MGDFRNADPKTPKKLCVFICMFDEEWIAIQKCDWMKGVWQNVNNPREA
jgi:hypothetical protein